MKSKQKVFYKYLQYEVSEQKTKLFNSAEENPVKKILSRKFFFDIF